MCGRFTLTASRRALLDAFPLVEDAPEPAPRYNVCPTQPVLGLVEDAQGRPQWRLLRWGLVPAWAKEGGKGPPLINARAETADRRPAFRGPFRRRRCLVPADGFYEWQAVAGGPKQPWFFRLRAERAAEEPGGSAAPQGAKSPLPPANPQKEAPGREVSQGLLFPEPGRANGAAATPRVGVLPPLSPAPGVGVGSVIAPTGGPGIEAASRPRPAPGAVFALAGLWDTWLGPDGSEVDSCAVLTTTPNELLRPIHHRMPVILAADDHRRWLGGGDLPPADRERLFRPFPAAAMTAWKVGRGVGNPSRDDPGCIEALP